MMICCLEIKQGNMAIQSCLPYGGQAEGKEEQNVPFSLSQLNKDPADSCVLMPLPYLCSQPS